MRGHGDKVSSVKIVSYRKDDTYNNEQRKRKDKNLKMKRGMKRTHDEESLLDDSTTTWSQLVVSGSYDHTIRVWDIESTDERGEDRCVSIISRLCWFCPQHQRDMVPIVVSARRHLNLTIYLY